MKRSGRTQKRRPGSTYPMTRTQLAKLADQYEAKGDQLRKQAAELRTAFDRFGCPRCSGGLLIPQRKDGGWHVEASAPQHDGRCPA